jgi:hypothetical protein
MAVYRDSLSLSLSLLCVCVCVCAVRWIDLFCSSTLKKKASVFNTHTEHKHKHTHTHTHARHSMLKNLEGKKLKCLKRFSKCFDCRNLST